MCLNNQNKHILQKGYETYRLENFKNRISFNTLFKHTIVDSKYVVYLFYLQTCFLKKNIAAILVKQQEVASLH